MNRRYDDGDRFPYRVTYSTRGKSARELRFSAVVLARQEVEKLTRRGYAVEYHEWDFLGKRYITKDRYN